MAERNEWGSEWYPMDQDSGPYDLSQDPCDPFGSSWWTEGTGASIQNGSVNTAGAPEPQVLVVETESPQVKGQGRKKRVSTPKMQREVRYPLKDLIKVACHQEGVAALEPDRLVKDICSTVSDARRGNTQRAERREVLAEIEAKVTLDELPFEDLVIFVRKVAAATRSGQPVSYAVVPKSLHCLAHYFADKR
jgi:hypothetical protein